MNEDRQYMEPTESEDGHSMRREPAPTPISRGVWSLYKQSLKPNDSLFNLYLARPLAAPLVYLFAQTRVTPNQVTFMSTLIMIIALIALSSIAGPLGLLIGVIGVELSYVFDCVDGQLARVTGRTSEVGGDLDFMMDELKAYLLIVAIGLRGAFTEGDTPWLGAPVLMGVDSQTWPLICSIFALLVTASAITLTRFIRSERYAIATGSKAQKHGQSAGEGRSGGPLWPIKMIARLITQYPASLPIFALTNTLDIFLYAYGVLHLLYVAQASLGIFIKLGRFAPQNNASTIEAEEQR